jgi:DNA topoisomerase-3
VLVAPGWLAVYGKEAQIDDAGSAMAKAGEKPTLIAVKPNERVATTKIEAIANTTRPPARLSEATLLGDGRRGQADRRRRTARSDARKGSPARRPRPDHQAAIAEKYVYREGRELVPTAKAFSLMTLLHGLGVPELSRRSSRNGSSSSRRWNAGSCGATRSCARSSR